MNSLKGRLFGMAAPGSAGLTLLELAAAMVIVCILTIGSVWMYANPSARVKTAAFSLLADLNLARSESVNRNRDVLVDFILEESGHGYIICLDTDSDRECDDETAPDIIKEVRFGGNVLFYDCTSAPPYPEGGPTRTPSGTKLAGKNGLIFGGPNYLKWQPDGTSGDNGSIILYRPVPGTSGKVGGTPYAAVISSAATGRVRLMRWLKGRGWSRK